jgi:hypothetical protein
VLVAVFMIVLVLMNCVALLIGVGDGLVLAVVLLAALMVVQNCVNVLC